MNDKAKEALVEYLLMHEDDIANDINDFGMLRPVFDCLFNKSGKGE